MGIVNSGDAAELRGGIIRFENNFEIDVSSAVVWSPNVQKIGVGKFAIPPVPARMKDYVFIKPEYVDRFKKGVYSCNLSLIETSVDSLAGLGFGLTPSGDDFLAGFISAAHFFADCRQFDFFLKNVKINTGATNLISAQYIKYAVDGRISEIVSNVILSAAGRKNGLDIWIEKLLDIGALSGSDTFYGILTAMEVFNACKSC